MTGNTHRLWAGIATAAVLYQQRAFSIPPVMDVNMVLPVAVIIFGVVLGGLPDVDLKLHIPHRTITHALLWPVLLALFIPDPVGPALAAALLSHLALDCLAGRVQIFWPLPWWVGWQLVKTGSVMETAFNVLLALWLGWQFIYARL